MNRTRLLLSAVALPVVLGAATVGGLSLAAPVFPTSGPDTLFFGSLAAGALTLFFASNSRPRTGYRDGRRVVLSGDGADSSGEPLPVPFFGLTVYTASIFVGCWVVLLSPL